MIVSYFILPNLAPQESSLLDLQINKLNVNEDKNTAIINNLSEDVKEIKR